jgi:hypothetical protein
MPADLKMACRLAKASDVTYYIDKPGGVAACPFYSDVGFTSMPESFVSNIINAAIVGTTADAVILAFRGTLPLQTNDWDDFWDSVLDWLDDADAKLVPVAYTDGQVHKGFAEAVDSLWPKVMPSLREHLKSGLPLVVTGHSKGGALASLAAIRLLRAEGIAPTAVYTFASPRTGDAPFANFYNSMIMSDWRFENTDDIVPHLPPSLAVLGLLSQIEPRLKNLTVKEYRAVGTLEFINWKGLLVGNSLILDAERLTSFLELLAKQEIEKIVEDHSIERQYVPKVCALQ